MDIHGLFTLDTSLGKCARVPLPSPGYSHSLSERAGGAGAGAGVVGVTKAQVVWHLGYRS